MRINLGAAMVYRIQQVNIPLSLARPWRSPVPESGEFRSERIAMILFDPLKMGGQAR
jgi:hypothetical protein